MLQRSVGACTGWAASVIVLTAFVGVLLFLARVPIGMAALSAIALGTLVVVLAGECVLSIARLEQIAGRPIAALVLGSAFTSLALTGGTLLSGEAAGLVFIPWAAIVAAVAMAVRPWSIAESKTSILDLMALSTIALIILLWCHKAAGAVPTLEETGKLPLWIDYYIHGATTATFGDPLAAGHGDISLVGVPLGVYHFSFYQLAAAIQTATGASGLGIATSILLPLGLLLAAGGAYVLASELADRRAGVLALAILVLVPDASHYWLANGFFGFHWHMFATPGAGYGLAVAALSLATASQWFRTRNPWALGLSAALMLALMQFRAHFFIWLAPAALGTLVLASRSGRRHWCALCAMSVALLLVLAVAIAASEPLQRLWLSHSAILDYLHMSHTHSEPTGYTGLYAHLKESLGRFGAIVVGTLLLLPVMLGALSVIYPLALAHSIRTRGWQPLDAFPPLLAATGLIVTLIAPHAAGGHVSEYQHRAFVLLYMVLAVWTSSYLVRAVGRASARPFPIALSLVAVAAGAAALSFGAGVDPSAPRFRWSKNLYDVQANPSLVWLARAIRRTARPGDTIAVGPINPNAELVDQAIQVTSLTGIPAFLARPKNQMFEGDIHKTAAAQRLAVLQDIERSNDLRQALERLRQNGIDWYVWLGKAGPLFDPERRHAVFADANAAVYRMDPEPSGAQTD